MTRSAPHTPTEPHIRAFFMATFLQVALPERAELDAVLNAVGLQMPDLSQPYGWVPLGRYIAATEAAARRLGNPNLGLEIGQRFSLAELGPFYALTLTAQTLGDMLLGYLRFQEHWQTGTTLDLRRSGDTAELRYRIEDPTIWPRGHDAEFTMAGMSCAIRQVTDERTRPLEILFEHDIAGRETVLSGAFRCPVRGDQSCNAIRMPAGLLNAPLPMRRRHDYDRLHEIVEGHLLDLMRSEDRAPVGVVERVRQFIDTRLADPTLSQAQAAHHIGTSERTLRRQLADQGTSFRDLLQTSRIARACQLLESRANIPLEQLASKVGYADAASFSRAFSARKGVSPRRFAKGSV